MYNLIYLLSWVHYGGKEYVGRTQQNLDNRLDQHRKRGRLPFHHLGEPKVYILHKGLDLHRAKDLERKEILSRGTLEPGGYNQSSGG